jgi:hypothetical protein
VSYTSVPLRRCHAIAVSLGSAPPQPLVATLVREPSAPTAPSGRAGHASFSRGVGQRREALGQSRPVIVHTFSFFLILFIFLNILEIHLNFQN